MKILDAHHHLWNLSAVEYPWLNAKDQKRFFGDPSPIQRDYLIDEFRHDAQRQEVVGSVHIQVGAKNPLDEANWVHSVSQENLDWPMVQVAFCDLTAPSLSEDIEKYLSIPTVRGVRQIIGRAPEEDNETGTNDLLKSDALLAGLKLIGSKGLSFDLQLIPELIPATCEILQDVPNTKVALCHAGSPHDRSNSGLKDFSNRLKYMANLSNVTCKLSGLGMFDHNWTSKSITPIVNTCLDQFGESRCMFGSNFPVDSLYSNYSKLVKSYKDIIPDDCHLSVFYSVAKHFYFDKV